MVDDESNRLFGSRSLNRIREQDQERASAERRLHEYPQFIVRGYGLYLTPAQLDRGMSMVDDESNRLFGSQVYHNSI